VTDLKAIQELYDRHCFVEAYRRSSQFWHEDTDVSRLPAEELILGGRLAVRLGGRRLGRWLFRVAQQREPENPRVRYFTQHLRQRGRHFLELLREFQQQPELGSGDAELEASWCASCALTWAWVRDFETARACLERAKSFAARDAWVLSCEADVLGLSDRWQDALATAEQAWEISPGAPYAAQSLGNALVNVGRVAESAARLAEAAESGQSLEVAQIACWHLCALAETLAGDERGGVLQRARDLADRMPSLAPLADRESRREMARTRLDIAQLADDHQAMERWAAEARVPFFRRVLENLRANPRGKRIRLPFQRVIQKHDECMPTAIASALAAMGVAMDAAAMASEITFGGTYSWAAEEWLARKGLAVRFFAVTPEIAGELIRNGVAFVLTLEYDDSGHAVAVVGLDEAAGTLLVHDPQSFRSSEYLLKSFGEGQSPLAPEGMAIVPAEKAALLDRLLPAQDVEAMTASVRYQRAQVTGDPAAQRAVVKEMAERRPAHPGTRLLLARQAIDEGRTGEALAAFQELLKAFPNCVSVRGNLLAACRTLGNTARMREILADVVERGMLPGAQSQQDWYHPPASYVCEYADLLRASAANRGQARRMLDGVLDRQYAAAGGWHVLGDFLWQEHDAAGYLLCFRVAACLAPANEHYARAYCDALCEAGRESDGLAWLEKRVRTFGSLERAVATWTTWIAALEHRGHAERALAACREALREHRHSAPLLAFAIPFLARMGEWEEADLALRRLEAAGNAALLCEAAVDFHGMRGDLDAALAQAESWVRECPQATAARRQLLGLMARQHGDAAALERARQWWAERPGHEEFEEIYCEQLERQPGSNWKKELLLWRRVRRDREDGWAWRELAFRYLSEYDSADARRRPRWERRVEEVLAQCDRTSPDDPATVRARALRSEVRGLRREAIAGYLRAIELDPGHFFAYRRAWECAAWLEDAERRDLLRQLEALALSSHGRVAVARDLILLAAQRFGVAVAEEVAAHWRAKRPEDPNIVEAAADLLLEEGHGRSDAERALALLEPAVKAFPYHLGLRFSLARAYRGLGQFAKAEDTFPEIIRRHPDNIAAHLQMAWVHQRRGNDGEAQRLLDTAATRDPLSSEVWDARAQMLIHMGRFAEARATVTEALERVPENVSGRERAIRLLRECGEEEGAVAAAREGVRLYSTGAYLWYLLGTTLNELRRFAGQGEIESCLRRSLALNRGLFAAADSLAMLLVEQRSYDEAARAIEDVLPRMADPCFARGRLAWIRREKGETREAREEMTLAVRSAPWYGWGWRILMDWLAEDKAWDESRGALNPLPPEMRTDTHFRRQRLGVLGEAGLAAEELDREWKELLADFPEDVSLHLWRYDALLEQKRLADAAAALVAVRDLEPDNPYFRARWVEVLVRENKHEEAIENLFRLWFAEVELSDWPADYAWKAIQGPRLDAQVYQEAKRRLAQGARPTPKAVQLMAAYAMERETGAKKFPQPRWRSLLPGAGAREIRALLGLADKAPWDAAFARSILFKALSDFGYYRLVVASRRRNRAVVDGAVETWAQAAHALVELGQKRQARRMLANWRERSGVGMWLITNYLACFSRWPRKNLREILASCRDALTGLPHDHCARYLAHVQAEMCAVLGDSEGLRQTCETYAAYFGTELELEEWFKAEDRHLLHDIPEMARLLKEKRTSLYRKARRGLRWKQLTAWQYSGKPALQTERQDEPGRASVPWWVWWLLIMAAMQAVRLLER
jgi:tetratricopeptide (TPR) repeat protein